MQLDNRTRELIAIGASITANCQPCLEYHVGKARENGADEREIIEALAAGKTVRQGAGAKVNRFASTSKLENACAAGDSDCGTAADPPKIAVATSAESVDECACKR
ncbi:MAG: carboxymuconolactone decarboxylase family protein [Dehalococcoidia bacterium]|nr:carboxymuconolactone decarboxylase family protein [Dehalococcoidia bacterium]